MCSTPWIRAPQILIQCIHVHSYTILKPYPKMAENQAATRKMVGRNFQVGELLELFQVEHKSWNILGHNGRYCEYKYNRNK